MMMEKYYPFVFIVFSFLVAIWVFFDAKKRVKSLTAAFRWGFLTFLFFYIIWPYWLMRRPELPWTSKPKKNSQQLIILRISKVAIIYGVLQAIILLIWNDIQYYSYWPTVEIPSGILDVTKDSTGQLRLGLRIVDTTTGEKKVLTPDKILSPTVFKIEEGQDVVYKINNGKIYQVAGDHYWRFFRWSFLGGSRVDDIVSDLDLLFEAVFANPKGIGKAAYSFLTPIMVTCVLFIISGLCWICSMLIGRKIDNKQQHDQPKAIKTEMNLQTPIQSSPISVTCKKCGNKEFDYDSYWKEYVCKKCGWQTK